MKAVVMLSKVFFPAHPKAGKDTGFKEKVGAGTKIHTIRANYDYWVKKIERLKDNGGVLCLRQWESKPYRSPQETVVEIPAEVVAVELVRLDREGDTLKARVNDVPTPIEVLAKNDGFTNVEDFVSWFKPVFAAADADRLTFAVIHFTPFRYTINREAEVMINDIDTAVKGIAERLPYIVAAELTTTN